MARFFEMQKIHGKQTVSTPITLARPAQSDSSRYVLHIHVYLRV